MFGNELKPIFQQLTQHPGSFLGGFFSGLLRLNLGEDPVKSWLDQQLGYTTYVSPTSQPQNGKTSGPQSISIE
ncbi:hypothetical protein [Chroococcidiopsis sp. TS-821]|uniref:hypothetical protein n=1 Tax=Chroococcidiopsis sp. TS-821 TaxID=1378066 RepID=UPI000CEE1693|nr:hypothetical protein [Chroococcidiopsis sp. TS-821]PPS43276.1 hypothetical protein B1A85_11270 [Chroococcidiopsis sp. TS-821]